MVTLGHIRGQPRVVNILERAIAADRVPHAYLFTGPAGSGKYTTAIALAMAINCEDQPGVGCGSCASCERIDSGRHPDVVTLERKGASQTIPIEVIRQQVIPAMGQVPHEARARFFVIEEATSLLDPAANALLKTLEEPAPRSHFVLCTTSLGELLPTIKSRCQRVVFQPLPEQIRAELDTGDGQDLVRTIAELEEMLGQGRRAVLERLEAGASLASDRAQLKHAVRLLAQRYHEGAVHAARDGHIGHARRLGRCASLALECERGLIEHNAHAILAIDSLLDQLAALAEVRP